MSHAPLFDLFWENSKLSRRTALGFADRLDEDARAPAVVAELFHPGPTVPLPRPDDALAAVMAQRHSERTFADGPLSEAQLGSLFQAFARRPDGGRVVPSAGGKHPIEVFAFLFHVTGPLDRALVYYNGADHGLSVLGPAPPWDELSESVGLTLDGAPAALFVFAALPSRTTSRYGERGGRFFLLECGHHAQNLALRIAYERLAGVAAGGLHDDRFRGLLGLEATGAAIPLGYAVGLPV